MPYRGVCPTAAVSRPLIIGHRPTTVARGMATRRGAYPGTFNPPTVAHLAIADCSAVPVPASIGWSWCSRPPLSAKRRDPHVAPLDQRIADARTGRRGPPVARDRYDRRATDRRHRRGLRRADPRCRQVGPGARPRLVLRDRRARTRPLARLPQVALAPRPPHPLPQPSDGSGHPRHRSRGSRGVGHRCAQRECAVACARGRGRTTHDRDSGPRPPLVEPRSRSGSWWRSSPRAHCGFASNTSGRHATAKRSAATASTTTPPRTWSPTGTASSTRSPTSSKDGSSNRPSTLRSTRSTSPRSRGSASRRSTII